MHRLSAATTLSPPRLNACGHLNSHQGKRPCPAPYNSGHDRRLFPSETVRQPFRCGIVLGTTRADANGSRVPSRDPARIIRRLPSSAIRLLLRPHSQTSGFHASCRTKVAATSFVDAATSIRRLTPKHLSDHDRHRRPSRPLMSFLR
jgi:hypothetical protein